MEYVSSPWRGGKPQKLLFDRSIIEPKDCFIRLNLHVAIEYMSMTETISPPAGLAPNSKMKMVSLVGGLLIAIGVAGMIMVSLQVREVLSDEALWKTEGFWFQMKDYAFMFTMIAGLVLVLYSLISVQRLRAKRLGNTR